MGIVDCIEVFCRNNTAVIVGMESRDQEKPYLIYCYVYTEFGAEGDKREKASIIERVVR